MKKTFSIVLSIIMMATHAVYATDGFSDFIDVLTVRLWGIACILLAAGAFVYALRDLTKGSFTRRSILASIVFVAFTLIGFGLI